MLYHRLMLPLAASAATALVIPRASAPHMMAVRGGHGGLSMMAASGMSELEELKFYVGDKSVGSLYDYEAANAKGDTVDMGSYKGKAVLIVNVASLWGTTVRDFTQMNSLADKYGDKIAVLGFICNQFGHQSNGDEVEFANIIKHVRPGGGFEMMPQVELYQKCDVNGPDALPLFKWLKDRQKIPFGDAGDRIGLGCADNDALTLGDSAVLYSPISRGDVAWNFEKFLIGPDGKFVRRYSRFYEIDNIQADIDAVM